MTIEKQAVRGYSRQIRKIQEAFAFWRARSLPMDNKLAQPAISLAVSGIGQDVRRAVAENQARADQKLRRRSSVSSFHVVIGAHHARQTVAVGDADGGIAQRCGLPTNSSGWEAPRRKEKLVVTASSA